MAVYAISDLHGALDEFRHLLARIEFRYNGADELYLVGDYGDWGKKSLETIEFVRHLDSVYPFVHCLMGNHEEMFLTAAEHDEAGTIDRESLDNWLYYNRGLDTWNGYLSLPKEQKASLRRWLKDLPLSASVSIGGMNLMLAHAYPYYYDMNCTEREKEHHRHEALWRRLNLQENPFAGYTGTKRYDYFICGHTITSYYEDAQRKEKNPSFVTGMQLSRCRIFHGGMFLDIDCGAKCFDYVNDENPALHLAGQRAQLAALKLDTMEEYYVHPQMFLTDLPVPDMQSFPETVDDMNLQKTVFPSGVGRAAKAFLRARQMPWESLMKKGHDDES